MSDNERLGPDLQTRTICKRASLLLMLSLAGCGAGSQAKIGGADTTGGTTSQGMPGPGASNGTTDRTPASTTQGDDDVSEEDTGPLVELPSQWEHVAAGEQHTCAIATNGTLWCWGSTTQGVLGAPEVLGQSSPVPVRVGNRTDWEQIWTRSYHSCARAPDAIWCWGMNADGQLATGDVAPPLERSPVMSLVTTNVDDITLAHRHGCSIDDGSLDCWGRPPKASGAGSTVNPTPTNVPFDSLIVTYGASDNHACILTLDLEVWCWGRGHAGQLGNGSVEDLELPTRTFTNLDVEELAVVQAIHTCVRDSSGATYCVGRNDRGQFGNGMVDEEPNLEPQASPSLDGLRLTSGSGTHTCGVAVDGTLSCWGFNLRGQVGDGSTELRAEPVQVGDPRQWSMVTTGLAHTCAIDLAAGLWCWGSNDSGQVGDGSRDTTVLLPSRVGPPTP